MIINCAKESFLITICLLVIIAIVQVVMSLIIKMTVYLLRFLIKAITQVKDSTASKIVWWIVNRLTFIGVIHHELSHAAFAFIFGAKILKVDLFRPHGDTLGQVYFMPQGSKTKRDLQKSMVAIAPTLLGTLSSIVLTYIVLYYNTGSFVKAVLWYSIISILLHSTMSKQDIKTAKEGLILSVLIITTIVFLFNLIIEVGRYI